MRARNDQTSLHDMLAHAQEAAELLGDRSREALRRGRVLQLALTRLVEVIGEAAYRVSDEKRQQSTNIPWPQIIGMRAWVEILRPEHMAIRQWQMTRKPTLKTL